MIKLALSQEEQMRRAAGLPIAKPQTAPIAAPQVEKGPLSQMTDYAQQKLITSAVDKGAEALSTKAAEAMAGNAALQGVGTAMPYIGAGILAGKAFGLFNQGGAVNDQLIGPLAIRKIRYKKHGGKVEIEATMGE